MGCQAARVSHLGIMYVTVSRPHAILLVPAGLSSGSHLLTVASGEGMTQFDAFNVTVGAVGPQGPDGAAKAGEGPGASRVLSAGQATCR